MDLRQIQYIVAIAEENNITRAAEKLYITQSALNQQLLKLEKELGVQLFHRSRTDWHPTEAGEIYLKAAREMLLLKKDTYHRIHDLAKIQQGELSVGFTPGRGIAMFSNVYPKFHRLHPNIQVTPRELSVQKQQELLISGELDLGFVTLVPEAAEACSELYSFSFRGYFCCRSDPPSDRHTTGGRMDKCCPCSRG